LPFLFQSAYGATPLQSALLFTPWPAIIMIVAPISGRLADRVRPAALALTGLSIYLAGLVAIAALGDHPPTWLVLVATTLAGLGFGIFQSPNNKEMQGSVPMRHASSAAAVLNLNRNVAQSAGSGAVSVALVLTGAGAGSLLQEARAATSVLWVAVAGAAFAVVFSAAKLRTVVHHAKTK
ncbi:MAG: MFS transporter, partial [Propionibacteriaceae bacterium]|nr:MFS transporter [Propionibacteriaceae bacterium]